MKQPLGATMLLLPTSNIGWPTSTTGPQPALIQWPDGSLTLRDVRT